MAQPPYSPGIAPHDFFLFLKMKSAMKGQHFVTIEELKARSLSEQKGIPKRGFHVCFMD